MSIRSLWVALLLLPSAMGCQRTEKPAAGSATPAARVAKAPASKSAAPPAAPVTPTASAVTRIVFLDKEKACACDKKRVTAVWNTLGQVLGTPPSVPVERIHLDTQPLLAAPISAKRALMVPPGIYFLGPGDKLLKMLQGEVKAEQIKAALR